MKGLKSALLGMAGVAALAATVTLAAGEKIVGAPFAVGVTQKSATMVWIVQSDELTLRPAAGGTTLTSPSLRVEKTTLTGLQPNTRYEYDILEGADGGKGSFKTPPPAGPAPVSFRSLRRHANAARRAQEGHWRVDETRNPGFHPPYRRPGG